MNIVISNDLADFFEKPYNTKMSRIEIVRELFTYIRNNKLQDKNNPRIINPDKKLFDLFKNTINETKYEECKLCKSKTIYEKTEIITLFNIQKHLTPHMKYNNI